MVDVRNPPPSPKPAKTPKDQFPHGTIITWGQESGPAQLSTFHAPTVLVSGTVSVPIEFHASFDGQVFEKMRDLDGDVYSISKPGVYNLPVPCAILWPCIQSDAQVQVFLRGAQ